MSERAVPAIRQALGARLRALRKTAGLSQERLGEAAGLSGKFIGEVERGEKSISVDSLHRVAVALDQPLEGVVGFLDGRPPASRQAEQLYALALQQKPKTLAKVLAVVRELVA